MTDKTRIILEKLETAYPDAHCELNFKTPLQLLAATVMSAQTTDKQVNKVTAVLFSDHPDLDSLLTLSQQDIEGYIHSLGFYRTKAAHLYEMFRKLRDDFGGVVPQTHEELESLPGVGRKTANVVLANAFGQDAIAVDTHVLRVSNRIGLAQAKTPEETEKQLMENIDQSWWSRAHHLLIFHGRYQCHARKPECATCPIYDECGWESRG